MHAAVVTTFSQPPHYQEFEEPSPTPEEVLVEVLAVGLHPRVRSQANGSHYTSTKDLPLIPGIDGVGRRPDGSLVYFVLPDTRLGAMAERVAVDTRRCVELPADADPVLLAAGMNPAMSSWVALRRRIPFAAGQDVLVLGATGSAGRIAVQVAQHLGAGHVTAVGRDLDDPPKVTADTVVELRGDADAVARDLAAAAQRTDVVLDYLWGQPAAAALYAIVPGRADDSQPLTWVQIGSVAGAQAPIPSAALRATSLRIVGSGQGSVATKDILAELAELAAEMGQGTFDIRARPVPLAQVEQAWAEAAGSPDRLVIVPT